MKTVENSHRSGKDPETSNSDENKSIFNITPETIVLCNVFTMVLVTDDTENAAAECLLHFCLYY